MMSTLKRHFGNTRQFLTESFVNFSRIIIANPTTPLYLSDVTIVSKLSNQFDNKIDFRKFQMQMIYSVFLLSYVAGYLLCILVEAPFCALQKNFLGFSKAKGTSEMGSIQIIF